MSGAGLQSAGDTSAGFGTSDAATVFGGAFLRDTRTGAVLGARKVNPTTRGYELDANGRVVGMNSVYQMVQIAVHTTYNSSAVRGLGQRLSSLDRITANFDKRVLEVLREALQPLIRAGFIEVLGFESFQKGNGRNGMIRGGVYGRLRWRDLTTKQERVEIV